jgi:hypothetical protein
MGYIAPHIEYKVVDKNISPISGISYQCNHWWGTCVVRLLLNIFTDHANTVEIGVG